MAKHRLEPNLGRRYTRELPFDKGSPRVYSLLLQDCTLIPSQVVLSRCFKGHLLAFSSNSFRIIDNLIREAPAVCHQDDAPAADTLKI